MLFPCTLLRAIQARNSVVRHRIEPAQPGVRMGHSQQCCASWCHADQSANHWANTWQSQHARKLAYAPQPNASPAFGKRYRKVACLRSSPQPTHLPSAPGTMAPADLPNSRGCQRPPGFLPGPRTRTRPSGSGRSLSSSRRCIFPQGLSLLPNYMPVSMALRHKDDR